MGSPMIGHLLAAGHAVQVYARRPDAARELVARGAVLAASAGEAARGAQVRLWVDDAAALAWMAPEGSPGVQVLPWRDPLDDEAPADVVIEAFGCDPPSGYVARMAAVASSRCFFDSGTGDSTHWSP